MALVPEKRVDKNGVLTTKHVRAGTKTVTPLPSMPAPVTPSAAPQQKMSAAQRKQKPREYSLAMYDSDIELNGTVQGGKLIFSASNAEMLDVLSVVDKPGSALRLLNLGITTADEARAHMEGLGIVQASGERDELVRLAARRGMGMNFFLDHIEVFEEALRDNPDHDPDNLLDSVIFSTSKIGMGRKVTQEAIRDGNISYSDIKTIGTPRLASRNRLNVLHETLVKLNSGTADYTVDDVKELLRMVASEDMIDTSLESVVKMIEPAGMKTVLGVPYLSRVASAYDHYHQQTKWSSLTDKEKMERATYAVRILQESGGAGTHVDYDRFYAEGIPAEVAASVIARGGTVLAAKAIHEENIAPSVAGGWL
jgi:hypothetical protein